VLSTRGERPSCRTAKRLDELAPSHVTSPRIALRSLNYSSLEPSREWQMAAALFGR
jgi:hypothetical protein